MTNQASEDVDNILFEAIESAGSYIYKLTATEADYIQEQAKEAILAIIRTEKLKLLAEVRERVVGGDEPGVTNVMIAAEHAKQIDALTQLEAEL